MHVIMWQDEHFEVVRIKGYYYGFDVGDSVAGSHPEVGAQLPEYRGNAARAFMDVYVGKQLYTQNLDRFCVTLRAGAVKP